MQPKIIEAATNGSDSLKRVVAGAAKTISSPATVATYEENDNTRYTVESDFKQEKGAEHAKFVSGSVIPTLKRAFGHISTAFAYPQSADGASAEMIGNRPHRGRCLYQSRKCENERALKRNGKAHNLCDEHRSKQNQHQRKFDAKKFSRKRRKNSTGDVSISSGEGDENADQVRSNHDQPPTRPHVLVSSQPTQVAVAAAAGYPRGVITYEQHPHATTGYYSHSGHHVVQGVPHPQHAYYSHPTYAPSPHSHPQDHRVEYSVPLQVVYHQYPPHTVVDRSASGRRSPVAAPNGQPSPSYAGAPVNYIYVPQTGAFIPAAYITSNGQYVTGPLPSLHPPCPPGEAAHQRESHREYPHPGETAGTQRSSPSEAASGPKATEVPTSSGYSASELAAASILVPSGLASFSSGRPEETRTLASGMPTDAEKQEYYLRIVEEQKTKEATVTATSSPTKDSKEKKLPSLQIPSTTTKSMGNSFMSMSNVTSHAGALHNSGPPPVGRLPLPGPVVAQPPPPPRLPSLAPLFPPRPVTIPPASSTGPSPTKENATEN